MRHAHVTHGHLITCTNSSLCNAQTHTYPHKLTHTRAHAHSRTQQHLQTLSHTLSHTQIPARAPTRTPTQTPTRTPTQTPTRRRTEYTIPLHPICIRYPSDTHPSHKHIQAVASAGRGNWGITSGQCDEQRLRYSVSPSHMEPGTQDKPTGSNPSPRPLALTKQPMKCMQVCLWRVVSLESSESRV